MCLADVDIVTITQDVVTTMLDIDVTPGKPHPMPERLDHFTGWVQINGAWRGAVVLQASLGFVTHAASQMLSIRPEDVAFEDRMDALAEVTNMIGGNIKSLVPGPSRLSLPSVAAGQDFDFRVLGSKLVSDVPMICQNHLLSVLMCERDHDLDSARTIHGLA